MSDNRRLEIQLRFGKRITELRETKGYKKTHLANKMERDVQELDKIEKGKRNVTLDTLLALARALEVHPSELLKFDFDPLKD